MKTPSFSYSESDNGGSSSLWTDGKKVILLGEDMGDSLQGEIIPEDIKWADFLVGLKEIGALDGSMENESETGSGLIKYSFNINCFNREYSFEGIAKVDIYRNKKDLADLSPYNQLKKLIRELTGW